MMTFPVCRCIGDFGFLCFTGPDGSIGQGIVTEFKCATAAFRGEIRFVRAERD